MDIQISMFFLFYPSNDWRIFQKYEIFLKVLITFFIEHNFLWKYDINSRIQPSGKLKKCKVSRCSYREHCIASVSAVVSYIFLWGELWQSLPPLQRLVPACQPPEKNRWEIYSIKAILCYFIKHCIRWKSRGKRHQRKRWKFRHEAEQYVLENLLSV